MYVRHRRKKRKKKREKRDDPLSWELRVITANSIFCFFSSGAYLTSQMDFLVAVCCPVGQSALLHIAYTNACPALASRPSPAPCNAAIPIRTRMCMCCVYISRHPITSVQAGRIFSTSPSSMPPPPPPLQLDQAVLLVRSGSTSSCASPDAMPTLHYL
ncbi:hypothetical protein F4777DRAFT_259723 [Nemania sp. FL0916]|nr:hypothetical protein F4777DRAFT_259723 [Nemania sp. FL0916]